MRRHQIPLLVLPLLLALCADAKAQRAPSCDPNNAGLKLPAGFCATIFADSVRGARHIVVAPNGYVFVATRNSRSQGAVQRGGVVALRDTTRDGIADTRVRFGENGGSGIFLRGNNLWFATDDAVLRYTLPAGTLLANTNPDTIVRELPTGGHSAKTIAIGRDNDLFVNIGSQSNACQLQNRQAGSKGHDPCTELETRAGIWKFNAMEKNQRQTKDARFATGLRNVVAVHFAPDGNLYGAQHGRDNLSSNWSENFNDQQNAEKPAEILVRIGSGDDYGWPYCYYDQDLKRHVLAPEYGGDGKQETDRCDDADDPLVAFPGHWAPNGLTTYNGQQFPQKYRGGFFIAFHGSWNRAPLPQAGYNVVFVPMKDGKPGAYEVFAEGFPGTSVGLPGSAQHRPTGVAVAPDGSLYVTDDVGGRIYRIFYRGQ
jgi:glucose/arabinose dehydrogenase